MAVTAAGQIGTVGGGHLEWQACERARAMLAGGARASQQQTVALGPSLGQCCGGQVTLRYQLVEQSDRDALNQVVFNGEWFKKMNFTDVIRLNSRVTLQQMLQREDGQPGDAYHIVDGSTIAIDKGYHPCCVLPGYQMYYFTILGGLTQRPLVQYFQPSHADQIETIPGIKDMIAKFK